MKRKLSVLTILLLLFISAFGLIQVKAETFLTTTFDVVSYFDDFNETSTEIVDAAYGTILSFDEDLGSMSGYTFKYWIVNDVVQYGASVDTEFFVTEGIEVKAMFSPSDTYLVLFMDANGEYLSHDYVANLAAADDTGITLPDKPGYVVSASKWDEDISSVTEDMICILQYDINTANTYTLTVENGTGGGTYLYNTEVTLVADADSESNYFHYWEDEDGNILSYSSTIKITALANHTFTAVFMVEEPGIRDVTVWADTLDLRSGYRTYHARFELDIFMEVIEYGVITSVGEQAGGLDYNNADEITKGTRYIENLTDSGFGIDIEAGEFLVSVPKDHFYARTYVTYMNGFDSSINIAYGPLVEYDDTLVAYTTDIEDQSKTSYASGVENLNGRDWILSDVLIGALANDKTFDDKALRFQDSGYIQSVLPFEQGIDYLRLHYGKYGSDVNQTFVVKYAYEWDPTTWYTIQEEDSDMEISVDSADLESIIIDIEVYASIYLRIEKISSDGNKFNMDNIIVNEGEYINVAPTISDHIDATMTEAETYDPTAGVTAFDMYDGDLFDDITVEVKDSGENVVVHGDFSGLAIGDYTVTLTVDDSGSLFVSDTYTLTIEASSAYVATGIELYISEYIEGSGSNKVLEIYNPTASDIDLDGYQVLRYTNGSSSVSGTYSFIAGTLLGAGETVVLYNGSADAEFKNKGDINIETGVCSWNGDDAIELVKDGTVIDSIGQVGFDPGSAWTASGVSTANMTLVRKSSVNSGDTNSSDVYDPSVEWEQVGITDDYSDLGTHTPDVPEE